MSDREMLKLAAKAAGREVVGWHGGDTKAGTAPGLILAGYMPVLWNPLTDDGDALRLAVQLGMQVGPNAASREPMIFAWARERGMCAEYVLVGTCSLTATRRAIVRAAAEIGKSMKGGA